MGILTLALGGYVLIGFLLLLIACLIVGITLWTTGGRSKGSGEMSCGACGYPVRGLEALNCPECGADLRMAGINRSGNPRSKALGMMMVFASVGIFAIGVVGVLFLSVPSPSPSPLPASISQPASPSTTISAGTLDAPVDVENPAEQPEDDAAEVGGDTTQAP